jgi:iron complex outermembrane receptor protein
VDNDSYQYENQVRLEGTTGELLDWSVGTFFQRERSELLAEGAIFQELGLRIDQTNKVKSYGVHAETAWHIGDAFTLTMGARFNRDFKETSLWRDNGQKFLFSGSVTPVGLCIVARDVPAYAESLPDRRVDDQAEDGLWCEDDWRRWTGGIALEWRPSDDHLLYAQYDTGYKAGGFIVAGAGDFEPETVQAWTLGSKSLLLGGLLTLNLEAFFYEYENYQVVEIDGLTLRTENAPKARVWGAEVEFDAEPLPGLRLNGQAGYLNTEFTDYCSVDPTFAGLAFDVRNDLLECDDLAGGAVKALDDDGNRLAASTFDLDGNDLARSPKFSYTLGAEYRFSLGDWGSLTPRIQYYWQDETYYRAYNTARDFQEKYHKTDLKLLWRSPEESWTLEAFVENLEDEDVFQNLVIGGAPVGSPAVGYYSSPRLYGFRVGYRF